MLVLRPALGVATRRLSPTEDARGLQALFESCHDYFESVGGIEAFPDEANRELADVPPGVAPDAKVSIGFFDRIGLCGYLDIIQGYPGINEWLISHLLFAARARDRGIGHAAIEEIVAWMQREGASVLRAWCAVENHAAQRFWKREGFRALTVPRPKQRADRTILMSHLGLCLPR